MQIETLTLKAFGKFEDQTFSFQPGLNLIVGKNETGKSTLFQAILGILFGYKNDRTRYLPWQNPHRFEAALSLKTGDRNIHLERNFLEDLVIWKEAGKTFEGKASPLGRSSEREMYYDKLQALFGFSDPDIFKQSLFIEQRALHALPSLQTTTEIKQLISNIAEFRYDEIIERLENKYFDLTKQNPEGMDKRNDRTLEMLRKKIKDLTLRIQKAHEGQEALKKMSHRISELKEKLEKNEVHFEALSKSLEAKESLKKLLLKERDTSQSLADHEKKEGLIQRLTSQIQALEKTKPSQNRLHVALCLLSFFAIPGILFALHVSLLWGLPVCLIPAFLLIQNTLKFKTENHEYRLKILKISSQLEVLPKKEWVNIRVEDLKKLKTEIEVEKEMLTSQILEEDKQTEKKEKLQKEIKVLTDTLTLEKQNYLYLSKGLESPFTLEEDLFDLTHQEKRLTTKAKALWLAKETLKELVIDYRKEHLNLFAKDTKDLFQAMTPTPLDTLEFSEEDLEPKIQNQDTEISFSSLSCGTQDQLYFSMKFTLLKLLGSDRKLPIFLDDPFVNFDHERRKLCCKILKKYAAQHQIFLFTYDPWYIKVLGDDYVIQMDALNRSNTTYSV